MSSTSEFRWLYIVGGFAFIILGIHVIGELGIFISLGPQPANPTAAETLAYANAHRSHFVALMGLITSGGVLLAPAYGALYIGLRAVNRGAMALVAVLMGVSIAFGLGTGVIPGIAMIRLTDGYAAATTDAERASYVAAAQAIQGLQAANFLYFLLLYVATLVASLVMLRSEFRKPIGYLGIALGAAGLLSAAPPLAPLFLPGILLFIPWSILVGTKLLKLSRRPEGSRNDS